MSASWMLHQVVYQIFPDRFAIGKAHTNESKLALPAYQGDKRQRRAWDDKPKGSNDFFGGDLPGITDKLDYLHDLGVTCLYLTPVFTSPTNHKYDTTDYDAIDEQFGGKKALKALIDALHLRRMRLILDISINHVSDRHPWFVAAKAGTEPYRDWFTFKDNGNYLCWRDYKHMPELNLQHHELQNVLFKAQGSVMQRYLDMGLDGWRLDVAADMGVGTMAALRHAISASHPDSVLIGEVMAFGGAFIGGLDRYHGVMNYYFRDGILAWLHGKLRGLQMIEALRDAFASGSLASWNMLSSHDTARLASSLGDPTLCWLALVAQFTAPGVPMIYYGEEIGMAGGEDPDCRRAMEWDRSKWSMERQGQYRALIELRKVRRELREGRFVPLSHTLATDALVFLRHTDLPQEVSLVAINPTTSPLEATVLLPYSHLYHGLPMRDMLASHSHLLMGAGSVTLQVAPRSAAVWVPDESRYRHYTFYKS